MKSVYFSQSVPFYQIRKSSIISRFVKRLVLFTLVLSSYSLKSQVQDCIGSGIEDVCIDFTLGNEAIKFLPAKGNTFSFSGVTIEIDGTYLYENVALSTVKIGMSEIRSKFSANQKKEFLQMKLKTGQAGVDISFKLYRPVDMISGYSKSKMYRIYYLPQLAHYTTDIVSFIKPREDNPYNAYGAKLVIVKNKTNLMTELNSKALNLKIDAQDNYLPSNVNFVKYSNLSETYFTSIFPYSLNKEDISMSVQVPFSETKENEISGAMITSAVGDRMNLNLNDESSPDYVKLRPYGEPDLFVIKREMLQDLVYSIYYDKGQDKNLITKSSEQYNFFYTDLEGIGPYTEPLNMALGDTDFDGISYVSSVGSTSVDFFPSDDVKDAPRALNSYWKASTQDIFTARVGKSKLTDNLKSGGALANIWGVQGQGFSTYLNRFWIGAFKNVIETSVSIGGVKMRQLLIPAAVEYEYVAKPKLPNFTLDYETEKIRYDDVNYKFKNELRIKKGSNQWASFGTKLNSNYIESALPVDEGVEYKLAVVPSIPTVIKSNEKIMGPFKRWPLPLYSDSFDKYKNEGIVLESGVYSIHKIPSSGGTAVLHEANYSTSGNLSIKIQEDETFIVRRKYDVSKNRLTSLPLTLGPYGRFPKPNFPVNHITETIDMKTHTLASLADTVVIYKTVKSVPGKIDTLYIDKNSVVENYSVEDSTRYEFYYKMSYGQKKFRSESFIIDSIPRELPPIIKINYQNNTTSLEPREYIVKKTDTLGPPTNNGVQTYPIDSGLYSYFTSPDLVKGTFRSVAENKQLYKKPIPKLEHDFLYEYTAELGPDIVYKEIPEDAKGNFVDANTSIVRGNNDKRKIIIDMKYVFYKRGDEATDSLRSNPTSFYFTDRFPRPYLSIDQLNSGNHFIRKNSKGEIELKITAPTSDTIFFKDAQNILNDTLTTKKGDYILSNNKNYDAFRKFDTAKHLLNSYTYTYVFTEGRSPNVTVNYQYENTNENLFDKNISYQVPLVSNVWKDPSSKAKGRIQIQADTVYNFRFNTGASASGSDFFQSAKENEINGKVKEKISSSISISSPKSIFSLGPIKRNPFQDGKGFIDFEKEEYRTNFEGANITYGVWDPTTNLYTRTIANFSSRNKSIRDGEMGKIMKMKLPYIDNRYFKNDTVFTLPQRRVLTKIGVNYEKEYLDTTSSSINHPYYADLQVNGPLNSNSDFVSLPDRKTTTYPITADMLYRFKLKHSNTEFASLPISKTVTRMPVPVEKKDFIIDYYKEDLTTNLKNDTTLRIIDALNDTTELNKGGKTKILIDAYSTYNIYTLYSNTLGKYTSTVKQKRVEREYKPDTLKMKMVYFDDLLKGRIVIDPSHGIPVSDYDKYEYKLKTATGYIQMKENYLLDEREWYSFRAKSDGVSTFASLNADRFTGIATRKKFKIDFENEITQETLNPANLYKYSIGLNSANSATDVTSNELDSKGKFNLLVDQNALYTNPNLNPTNGSKYSDWTHSYPYYLTVLARKQTPTITVDTDTEDFIVQSENVKWSEKKTPSNFVSVLKGEKIPIKKNTEFEFYTNWEKITDTVGYFKSAKISKTVLRGVTPILSDLNVDWENRTIQVSDDFYFKMGSATAFAIGDKNKTQVTPTATATVEIFRNFDATKMRSDTATFILKQTVPPVYTVDYEKETLTVTTPTTGVTTSMYTGQTAKGNLEIPITAPYKYAIVDTSYTLKNTKALEFPSDSTFVIGSFNKPNFSVDYNLERIIGRVGQEYEYSRGNTNNYQVAPNTLDILEGEKYYIRKKGSNTYKKIKSLSQIIGPIQRYSPPTIKIDYTKETATYTFNVGGSVVKYQKGVNITVMPSSGISIVAGTDYEFYTNFKTDDKYKSTRVSINIDREKLPTRFIDFEQETLTNLSSTGKTYSVKKGKGSFANQTDGYSILPDTTYTLYTNASAIKFKSRDSVFTIGRWKFDFYKEIDIDYNNETTKINVLSNIKYADETTNNFVLGTGKKLGIIPEKEYYFYKIHSAIDRKYKSESDTVIAHRGAYGPNPPVVDSINGTIIKDPISSDDYYCGNLPININTDTLVVPIAEGNYVYKICKKPDPTRKFYRSDTTTYSFYRPAKPFIEINYDLEKTKGIIPDTVGYNFKNTDTIGTNVKINIEEHTNYVFWIDADKTKSPVRLKSDTVGFIINRRDIPIVSVKNNNGGVETTEPVDETYEYYTNNNLAIWTQFPAGSQVRTIIEPNSIHLMYIRGRYIDNSGGHLYNGKFKSKHKIINLGRNPIPILSVDQLTESIKSVQGNDSLIFVKMNANFTASKYAFNDPTKKVDDPKNDIKTILAEKEHESVDSTYKWQASKKNVSIEPNRYYLVYTNKDKTLKTSYPLIIYIDGRYPKDKKTNTRFSNDKEKWLYQSGDKWFYSNNLSTDKLNFTPIKSDKTIIPNTLYAFQNRNFPNLVFNDYRIQGKYFPDSVHLKARKALPPVITVCYSCRTITFRNPNPTGPGLPSLVIKEDDIDPPFTTRPIPWPPGNPPTADIPAVPDVVKYKVKVSGGPGQGESDEVSIRVFKFPKPIYTLDYKKEEATFNTLDSYPPYKVSKKFLYGQDITNLYYSIGKNGAKTLVDYTADNYNIVLPIVDGQNYYFWHEFKDETSPGALDGFFGSDTTVIYVERHLTPMITININDEESNEIVPSNTIYDQFSFSDKLLKSGIGVGNKIPLSEGIYKFFVKYDDKKYSSDTLVLDTIRRGVAPRLTLNYDDEAINFTSPSEYLRLKVKAGNKAEEEISSSASGFHSASNKYDILSDTTYNFHYRAYIDASKKTVYYKSNKYVIGPIFRLSIEEIPLSYLFENTLRPILANTNYIEDALPSKTGTNVREPIKTNKLYKFWNPTDNTYYRSDTVKVSAERFAPIDMVKDIDFDLRETTSNWGDTLLYTVGNNHALRTHLDNTKLKFTPGVDYDLYRNYSDKLKRYRSVKTTLNYPKHALPSWTIKYKAEKIILDPTLPLGEIVLIKEYHDGSNRPRATTIPNAHEMALEPGVKYLFRRKGDNSKKIFSSDTAVYGPIYRRPTPTIEINHKTEKTLNTLSTDHRYKKGTGKENKVSPAGQVDILVNEKYNFWLEADTVGTDKFLASEKTVVGPITRKPAPNIVIDYEKEIISDLGIGLGDKVEVNEKGLAKRNDIVTGATVEANKEFEFRTKADKTSYASSAFVIGPISRMDTPNIKVVRNFYAEELEFSNDDITNDEIEYSIRLSSSNQVTSGNLAVVGTSSTSKEIFSNLNNWPSNEGFVVTAKTRHDARIKKFASPERNLILKTRPDGPRYNIDYIEEKLQFSNDLPKIYKGTSSTKTKSNFISISSLTNFTNDATPGQSYYFVTFETPVDFASKIDSVVLENRIKGPVPTVDYRNEKLTFPKNTKLRTIAYSRTSINLTDKTTTKVVGTDYYISYGREFSLNDYGFSPTSVPNFIYMVYKPVTVNDKFFRSEVTSKVIKRNRTVPFDLSLVDETLTIRDPSLLADKKIEQLVEYSLKDNPYKKRDTIEKPTFSVTKDVDSLNKMYYTYLRLTATDTSFATEEYRLKVPPRSRIPNATINYVKESIFDKDSLTIKYDLQAKKDGAKTYVQFTRNVPLDEASGFPIPDHDEPTYQINVRRKHYGTWVNDYTTDVFFKSTHRNVVVPIRPEPVYRFYINYPGEDTQDSIPSYVEYKFVGRDGKPDGALKTGKDIEAPVDPDKYEEIIYSESAEPGVKFKSTLSTRAIPPRRTPDFGIDYDLEVLNPRINYNVNYKYTYKDLGVDVQKQWGNYDRLRLDKEMDIVLLPDQTGGFFKSNVQNLKVPPRPIIDRFEIDFEKEVLKDTILGGTYLSRDTLLRIQTLTKHDIKDYELLPGIKSYNLVYYSNFTSSSFRSDTARLNVPARPFVYIPLNKSYNYKNEELINPYTLSGVYIYDYTESFLDAKEIVPGENIKIYPGKSIYIRKRSTNVNFASFSKEFKIQERIQTPGFNFNFDYDSLKTLEPLPDIYEYVVVDKPNYTQEELYAKGLTYTSGQNTPFDLTPGSYVLIRRKSNDFAFASKSYAIKVYPRRNMPHDFTFNFMTEYTNEIVEDTLEYTFNGKFTLGSKKYGGDTAIVVYPGDTFSIRSGALEGKFFPSETFKKLVPPRPIIEPYSLNYEEETTNEPIPSDVKYRFTNRDTLVLHEGNDEILSLTPGKNIVFWSDASPTTFKSEELHLYVPEKPFFKIIDSSNSENGEYILKLTVDTINKNPVTELDFENIFTNLVELNQIDKYNYRVRITAQETDKIPNIRLKPGVLEEGNFGSIWLAIPTGSKKFLLYPNPSYGNVNLSTKEEVRRIDLYDVYGSLMNVYYNVSSIDISILPEGIYILNITTESGEIYSEKVMKILQAK